MRFFQTFFLYNFKSKSETVYYIQWNLFKFQLKFNIYTIISVIFYDIRPEIKVPF